MINREEFNELLDGIRPDPKEQIERRIRMGSFAKVVIWACVNSSDTDFLCVRDLARFMRISLQRARYILEDMVKFELLRRNKLSGCSVDYYFVYDEYTGKPTLFKYFDLARDTLGIKLRAEDLKVENRKV